MNWSDVKMKKIEIETQKNILVEILSYIHNICINNGINYSLIGGSLIGAIRHNGIIPWDDDIDIMLFRDDYEKLIKILKNQSKYDWLNVLDSESDGYYYTFAKAVDNRTVAKMEDNLTEHGLWVDIFPYDNLPDNAQKRKKYILKGYFYRSVIMSMTTDFNSNSKIKKRFIKRILKFYSNFLNREKFVKKYEKFSMKYKNINTKFVGCLFSPYKLRECFNKEWFEKRKLFSFENEKFYGPTDYEKFLSQLYGNYMELPPAEKQRDHKINAWMVK